MRNRVVPRWLVALVSTAFGVALAVASTAGQSTTAGSYRAPRMLDGKPDINGIWQVLNTASWDIQAHNAADGVPAGQGVVEGGQIPYQPWAAEKKKQNALDWKTEDPLQKCFLAGVPRATYLPFPFQIIQTPRVIGLAYEYNHGSRTIYTDGSPHSGVDEFWMGDSRGHWEGETLVVDVNGFNDQTWFDRAGNFHSEALHVVERYTRISPDVMTYEATIEDAKVFTRPWKMSLPLYRRQEKNVRLLDYVCLEFREPFVSFDELSKTR